MTAVDPAAAIGAAMRCAADVQAAVSFTAACDDLAATLAGQGISEAEALDAALVFASGAAADGFTGDDAESIARDAVASCYADAAGALDVTVRRAHRTDAGNAKRLVRLHGADVRHVSGLGWLQWDGRRWLRDEDDKAIMRHAIATAASIFRAGGEVRAEDGGALVKWGLQSESAPRLRAMIDVARANETIAVDVGQLDANDLALNVANGTVNLRTGKLRAHERTDLMTKLAPVTFDPAATCPRFDRFLREVFEDDDDLIAFAQRAVGYSLTGDTAEQVLFIAHGDGANGKSTFLELLGDLLGGYSTSADPASFTTAASGRSVRSDLARLRGARLVRAAEVDRDAHLAESLVKQLTGGESITAAFKHRNEFEYRPQLKLWLAVNDLPRIGSDGPAVWRRVRVLPFRASFALPDRGLAAELRAELPGVLAWAVRGAVHWHTDGLRSCPAVEHATAAYRGEQDRVAAFIGECCERDPDGREEVGALATAYVAWERDHGRTPVTDLPTRLTSRGYPVKPSNGKRYRHGLRLTTVRPSAADSGTSLVKSHGDNGNGAHSGALPAPGGGSL